MEKQSSCSKNLPKFLTPLDKFPLLRLLVIFKNKPQIKRFGKLFIISTSMTSCLDSIPNMLLKHDLRNSSLYFEFFPTYHKRYLSKQLKNCLSLACLKKSYHFATQVMQINIMCKLRNNWNNTHSSMDTLETSFKF